MMRHSSPGTAQNPTQGTVGGLCHLQLDLAGKMSLDGSVESVSIEPGNGMPSFVMTVGGKKTTVIVSPYWALANAGVEIKVGDQLSLLAFPALQEKDTFVAAEVKNLTSGKSVILRDDNGVPTAGRGPRHGAGICRCQ
jgi:hypothetical protein